VLAVRDGLRHGGEGDRAAARHGVTGVRGKVHQGRLKLAAVGQDWRQAGRRIHLDGDIGAQCVGQHLAYPVEQRGHIEWLGPQFVTAGEGQQAVGDRGATLGGVLHHPPKAPDGLRVIRAMADQVGATQDSLHDVVEVVCDAARQPAKRGELLGLCQTGLRRLARRHLRAHAPFQVLVQAAQRGLRLPQFGDVCHALHQRLRLPRCAPAQHFASSDRDHCAVAPPLHQIAAPCAVAP
jgi:hypothetical protein